MAARPRDKEFNPKKKAELRKKAAPKKAFKLPTVLVGATHEVWYTNSGGGNAKRVCLTEYGLEQLARMAAKGMHIATMAYVLGLQLSTFKHLLDRKDKDADGQPAISPEKAAYELGRAMWQDQVMGNLTRMSKTQVIAAIYLTKSQFGMRDNDPVTPQEGEKHVHIHFPDSMSREEYFKSIQVAHQIQHDGVADKILSEVATTQETTKAATPASGWPPKADK